MSMREGACFFFVCLFSSDLFLRCVPPHHRDKANTYWEKASNSLRDDVQGELYALGLGRKIDHEKGFKHLLKALEAYKKDHFRNAAFLNQIARCYWCGWGTPRNNTKADECWLLGCEEGITICMDNVESYGNVKKKNSWKDEATRQKYGG